MRGLQGAAERGRLRGQRQSPDVRQIRAMAGSWRGGPRCSCNNGSGSGPFVVGWFRRGRLTPIAAVLVSAPSW